MSFSTQITDLVGGTIDQDACDQWLEDGVRELINVFPSKLKEMCYAKSTFTSAAAGSEAETIASQHLGSVYAGSVACRKIIASDKYKAADSGSVEFATSTDPVYYIEGGKLNILPASLSGIYYIVGTPSIDADSDSSISNFPDEAEYLVVLYASIKQLHQYMNSKKGDLPTFTSPVKPSFPSLSAQTVTISGTAPTYIMPVKETQVAFSSYTSGLSETDPGVFSLSAVTPAVPSLSSTSISFSQAAPTFSKQVVAPDFAQVNTYIDTNEDTELAGAKLQEIGAQLQKYSADIQNEQAKFNKESVEYQAQLQISIHNAQFDNQEDGRTLQKYQAEVASFQSEVTKQVQEYTQKLGHYTKELNTSYQAWAKTESDNLTSHTSDIQNELNRFNKENVEYQAKLQKDIHDTTFEDANEGRKLSKYQAETQTYTSEINVKVQEFTLALQKHTTDYQWYQGQHAALKADYQQGLQLLTGGGASPPPAQQ